MTQARYMIENEPTADVYKRYQVFCADNAMQPMSNIVFSKQINKRLGFRAIQKKLTIKIVRYLFHSRKEGIN